MLRTADAIHGGTRNGWLVRSMAALVCLGAMGPAPGWARASDQAKASSKASEPIKREYQHAVENGDRTYEVDAAPGEVIVVEITETCPEYFDYAYKAFLAASMEKPTGADNVDCAKAKDPVKISITHSAEYGGYMLEIRRNDTPGTPRLGDVLLQPVTLFVKVNTKRWLFEVAGAFTASELVDPKFATELRVPASSADDTKVPFVVADRDAEDSHRLGMAAFVHTYHSGWKWGAGHPALTFGLGLNEASKTNYFLGLSYRFGDAMALTVGYNWGTVDRLPTGTRVGDQLTPEAATNLLNNLGSRVDGELFFGVSYKFLNSGDKLKDKLQQVIAGSGSAEAKAKPQKDEAPDTTAALEIKSIQRDGDKATIELTAAAGAEVRLQRFSGSKCKTKDGELIVPTTDSSSVIDKGLVPDQDYSYHLEVDGQPTGDCKEAPKKDPQPSPAPPG